MITTLLAPAPATSPAASRRPSVPAARRAVPLEASVARFLPAAEHNLGPLETPRLRTALEAQAARAPPPTRTPLAPDQTILQLDAGSLRERDAWGHSAPRRRPGTKPERWHRVWTGTVFRPDHRGPTAGGRPVISERGYGLTRQGLDALRQQRHGEALRRSLGQAAGVRVMGDGAVWIWRRAGGSDRSAGARPVQAARPVLEPGGRRSAAVPGNLLAQ